MAEEDTVEYWKEQAAIKENQLIELQQELETTKQQNEEEKQSLELKIKTLEEEKKDTFPGIEESTEPKESSESEKLEENGAESNSDEAPKVEEPKVEDLIREKDLNNVDILLSTILKEMQDMKAKVSLIEKAVLLDSKVADSQIVHSSAYHSSGGALTNGALEISPSYNEYPVVSNDRFREAFHEKSEELESIQKELLQIKASQSKLALQKVRNDRMIANQRPLSKFEVSTRKELQKVTSAPRFQTSSKFTHAHRAKLSAKGETGITPKGILKTPTRVSKFESKTSPSKPATFSPGVVSEGYGSSEEELGGFNGLEEFEEESGYKGRVRPSDEFDWTKGVNVPSMAFSQETLDRGNKFVRKVQKKYDKDHPETPKLDADEEDIERILRGSFHETDDGTLAYMGFD